MNGNFFKRFRKFESHLFECKFRRKKLNNNCFGRVWMSHTPVCPCGCGKLCENVSTRINK
jgi:hypothetical protein